MRLRRSLLPVPLLVLGASCGRTPLVPRVAPGATLASITVTSPSFTEMGRIPVDNTCDGRDLMPELVLSSPPDGTKSLSLFVEDPDATGGMFTHLVAFDLSPDARKISSAVDLAALGESARFGLNDFKVARYSGPCPPKGEAHRYRFRVVALDTMLQLAEGTPRTRVDEAMDGHLLGEGALTGQFGH